MSQNQTKNRDNSTLLELKEKVNKHYLIDENAVMPALVSKATNKLLQDHHIEFRARELVEKVRDEHDRLGIEAFLQQYNLSSEEGVVLMCLAEALLRIPDSETADRLIRDKIAPAEWYKHKGLSHSLFVNASTWGLMLTGKFIRIGQSSEEQIDIFSRLVSRVGEPVIRTVLKQAMRLMGSQYVMEKDIESALTRTQNEFHENYSFSFDMLGEAALTAEDAQKYFDSYLYAIQVLGATRKPDVDIFLASNISIKLSALHPRYEYTQRERVIVELYESLRSLLMEAKKLNVAITIDAEESDRLDMSLGILEKLLQAPEFTGWNGLGLAVQAYQKRALPLLEWLVELAWKTQKIIPVRLVKGAYWDAEIKRAQELGLESYPVFTRKSNTDVSYLACAKYLFEHQDAIFPQFATHNAHTVASIIEFAKEDKKFEFQRLHGMGERLYAPVVEQYPCRIYSPVGAYEDLLPYLVRRLLENGANTSFVNRIENEDVSVDEIIRSPVVHAQQFDAYANPRIPLPIDLYGEARPNSRGTNLSDQAKLASCLKRISVFKENVWQALPLVNGKSYVNSLREIINPYNGKTVGTFCEAAQAQIELAIASAEKAVSQWRIFPLSKRIEIIVSFADLLQDNRYELYALLQREAGKVLTDAISEVREAIDFCHYYAKQAHELLATDILLPGPTGEENTLQMLGRGVFVCISPWNFPLAIFTGQIVAALLTGNVVIAKPSSRTPLIAAVAVHLMLEAGLPKNALHFLPCGGRQASQLLLSDKRVSGVAFTGSYETAQQISQTLAARDAPISPLIAETGGLNVMLVDSSALPQQVVKDVLTSAFNSAGQRCSALRVLLVQEDIQDIVESLLKGAMAELVLGSPEEFTTDIPPVIDKVAKQELETYRNEMRKVGKLFYEVVSPENEKSDNNFIVPTLIKIKSLDELSGEKFGPILHVMPYKAKQLEQVIRQINAMQYGLTLGIHSRINETINTIKNNVNVGNIYVNRNMIGAVVGVQPFGGEGLSGTGPKAGGPNYLQRFCTEKTVSVNVAAIGGNARLFATDTD